MRRRRLDWWVVAFLLLAATVRFPGLGARSLWFDEALGGMIARLDTAQVLANAAGSSHPPGYYFLLHLWRLAGESEFALRFPSAWFSLAAVALVARLGRDLAGRRGARLATLGMALAPFQVYYAQEARMYGLAIALSAGVIWTFLRGVRGNSRWVWWVYGVLVALGLYVHYFIALVVLALHLWLPLNWNRARRVLLSLAVADGLAAVAFVPQLVQFLTETGEYLGGVTSWQPRPTVLSPLTTLYYLLFGHVVPPGWGWIRWGWVGVGLFLVLALVVFAGASLARRGRQTDVLALLFVAIVPLLLILIVSFIAYSIYSERSFAMLTPALVLLVAWVADGPRRSPTPYLAAALTVLMALGVGLYHFQPDPAKPPIREALAAVAQEARETDLILHLQDASYLPALYYTSSAAGELVNAGQTLWLAPEVYALFDGRVVRPDDVVAADRVWVVVMPGYVGSSQAEWLARWRADYAQLEEWNWDGVQVQLFALGGTE
ncbi:MAG: glycosyltransferase family 39 protein [Anaerolineae bacterium]|nr:glycosyltransferase family 39 protein [Anaerolineae bacterium]